jgi:hypothetical protein
MDMPRLSHTLVFWQFTNRHAGNQFFRQMCVEHRPKLYQTQSPQVKRAVALQVIAAVEHRNPPGRFLGEKDGPDWVELTADEKMEKTLEALKYAGKRKPEEGNTNVAGRPPDSPARKKQATVGAISV